MADAADPVAALKALLLADLVVAAFVGERVFGGELPEGETRHMPRPAIVVAPSGGIGLTADSYAEHDTGRFDVFAYGQTPREAERLSAAADLCLRRVRRGVSAGTLIHWVKAAGGMTGARDPDAAWPRAFRSYQAFFALEAVS